MYTYSFYFPVRVYFAVTMEKKVSVDVKAKTKSHKHVISRHYSPSSFLLLVLGNVAYNIGVFSNSRKCFCLHLFGAILDSSVWCFP